MPRALREDAFTLFGVRMRCYILDNGQRVIHADDLDELMAVVGAGTTVTDEDEMARFLAWQEGCG